jgi:flagellar biogenesis protein FliO
MTESTITVEFLAMGIITLVFGYVSWEVKRLITKVDDLNNRVTKVETILDVLGDIRDDINIIRTDVEVLKSRK